MSFYSTALSSALSGVRTVARWLTGNPSLQPNAAQPALPPPGTQHYNANVAGGKKPNVQIINDWIVPSTMGWDLESLQAAILQLENGNLFAAHSLMLAMTRRSEERRVGKEC